jgi:hypothetical protein
MLRMRAVLRGGLTGKGITQACTAVNFGRGVHGERIGLFDLVSPA